MSTEQPTEQPTHLNLNMATLGFLFLHVSELVGADFAFWPIEIEKQASHGPEKMETSAHSPLAWGLCPLSERNLLASYHVCLDRAMDVGIISCMFKPWDIDIRLVEWLITG